MSHKDRIDKTHEKRLKKNADFQQVKYREEVGL